MPSTPQYTEVVAGTPELLFDAVKHHHEWAPKQIPHVFTNAERHEGEGHTGSVWQYDVHEDKHDHHGGAPKIKVVMEDYNPETLSYVLDYQGDPRYTHLKWHIRMLPGPDPNTTSIKWRLDYKPYDKETGAPDDLVKLNLVHAIFKDLAAHLEAEKAE